MRTRVVTVVAAAVAIIGSAATGMAQAWEHLRAGSSEVGQLESVAFGNHRYVVSSSKPGAPPQVLVSRNLKSWFGVDLTEFGVPIYDVIFAQGKFWAAGGEEYRLGKIMSSVDGVSWELVHVTGIRMPILELEYSDGAWVGVGDTESGGRLLCSRDGVTWTNQQIDVHTVAVSGGLWLGASELRAVYTSRDGVNWTPGQPVTGIGSVNGLAAGNGVFVAGGGALESGVPFAWSADGATWSTAAIANLPAGRRALPLPFWNITYGANGFVALGEFEGTRGEVKVFVSGDGKTWRMHPAPVDYVFRTRMSYAGGLYFIAAPDRLFASSDGVNWIERFGQ
jgi:hypothetical protein